jgi:hypothetical protein
MTPMIGVDHEAFQDLADKGGNGRDEIRLPWRGNEDGTQPRYQRCREQDEIAYASDPALNEERREIDVVLL